MCFSFIIGLYRVREGDLYEFQLTNLGTVQMSLLQDLPFSLCQPGSAMIDGVGNYYLQVFDQADSVPLITLYLLDSHGQMPSNVQDPDYHWIKQSQIDWFRDTSQALRKARDGAQQNHPYLSLSFMHIPLPEYADDDLLLKSGQRREPTEGPSFNSRFYDVLAAEGVAAVGCGHDHVNDFCALKPRQAKGHSQPNGDHVCPLGPWLCYGGGSGFGGYCSYNGKRYHRRSRVWEFDTKTEMLKTWKRVEYARERVDELVLVEFGEIVAAPHITDGKNL